MPHARWVFRKRPPAYVREVANGNRLTRQVSSHKHTRTLASENAQAQKSYMHLVIHMQTHIHKCSRTCSQTDSCTECSQRTNFHLYPKMRNIQRKTKGQQLKGKIVLALFHTFWHFSTLFTLFQSFSEFFLQDFFLELRGFTAVLVQRQ